MRPDMVPPSYFKIILPWVLLACLVLFARWASADPATTWTTSFEATPAGSDLASTLDNRITEFKATTRELGEVELCWGDSDTDGCSTGNSGRARQGAARAFFATASPSNLHALDKVGSASLDNGRLWVDSDSSPVNHLQVYDSAWEDVDGVPASDRTSWNNTTTQVTEHLKAVRATMSADDDVTDGNCATPTAINFDTEAFDDDTMHDNVTNNTRLTTPTGATRVRVTANINHEAATNAFRFRWNIRQDGSAEVAKSNTINTAASVDVRPSFVLDSGPITVTGGTTYFELMPETDGCALVNGDGDLVLSTSWFAMEVLQ